MTEHTRGLLHQSGLESKDPHWMRELRDSENHAVSFCGATSGRAVADARRLVACWNACDGITTERLEDLGRPLMAHLIGCDERAARQVKEADSLRAVNAQLLAAAKKMDGEARYAWSIGVLPAEAISGDAARSLSAAIASAEKGGA